MGLAPAGAVVGELVNSLGDDAGPTVWRHEHDVLAAYRSGLREAGADVAEEAIELAYAASSILRQGIFMLVMLGQELAAADSAGGSRSDAGDRFVAGSGNMFARLAELAPRALSLAGG